MPPACPSLSAGAGSVRRPVLSLGPITCLFEEKGTIGSCWCQTWYRAFYLRFFHFKSL